MNTLKFYTDTHVPKAVAIQLRAQGIEVIRCEEVGLAESDDVEHLEYATSKGCTLVSHDLDLYNFIVNGCTMDSGTAESWYSTVNFKGTWAS
jgi:predicted nuclease of predicted toxin-antitoxin system